MVGTDSIVDHSRYSKYKTVKCFKCNGVFVIGDKVHNVTTKGGIRKIYHKHCWDLQYN